MTGGPAWFVQTAGVGRDEDYRWLPLTAGADPAVPQAVVYQPVGDRPLVELISDQWPSVVLWRRPDRSFVLYADGLVHPGAPAGGDYQGRAIRTTLLGIAPAGTDPVPLLDAAAVALVDELAATIPVRWSASGPALTGGADRWQPPAVPSEGEAADLRRSRGLPWDRRSAVAHELGTLREPELRSFPGGRILLIATELLSVPQLEGFHPWRALTPALSHPREFKEDKRRPVILVVALAGLGVLALIAILAWHFTREPEPPGPPAPPGNVATTPGPKSGTPNPQRTFTKATSTDQSTP